MNALIINFNKKKKKKSVILSIMLSIFKSKNNYVLVDFVWFNFLGKNNSNTDKINYKRYEIKKTL